MTKDAISVKINLKAQDNKGNYAVTGNAIDVRQGTQAGGNALPVDLVFEFKGQTYKLSGNAIPT